MRVLGDAWGSFEECTQMCSMLLATSPELMCGNKFFHEPLLISQTQVFSSWKTMFLTGPLRFHVYFWAGGKTHEVSERRKRAEGLGQAAGEAPRWHGGLGLQGISPFFWTQKPRVSMDQSKSINFLRGNLESPLGFAWVLLKWDVLETSHVS